MVVARVSARGGDVADHGPRPLRGRSAVDLVGQRVAGLEQFHDDARHAPTASVTAAGWLGAAGPAL